MKAPETLAVTVSWKCEWWTDGQHYDNTLSDDRGVKTYKACFREWVPFGWLFLQNILRSTILSKKIVYLLWFESNKIVINRETILTLKESSEGSSQKKEKIFKWFLWLTHRIYKCITHIQQRSKQVRMSVLIETLNIKS